MTNAEMFEMRKSGATYQAIAEHCGISKQAVYQRIYHYVRKQNGIRGKGFDINKIPYQGLYDWFNENVGESVSSLCEKVFGNNCKNRYYKFRYFIIGKHDSSFKVSQLQRLCEVTDKSLEELTTLDSTHLA